MAGDVEMHWSEELVRSPVIALIVGDECPTWLQDEPKKLYAHEAQLVRVPFFKKMLTGGFRESNDKIVHLSVDRPLCVDFILLYLQHGKVSTAWNLSRLWKLNETKLQSLANVWMLADKWQFPELQNELIGEMSARVNDGGYLGVQKVKEIYEGTSEESVLRKSAISAEWPNHGHLARGHIKKYAATQEILEDMIEEVLERAENAKGNLLDKVVYSWPKDTSRYLLDTKDDETDADD